MTRSTLFDRLNQELEAFGKKAQAALDEGKLQIELLRIRRRRDNAARDLGFLVHRRERGGATEPARIDALMLRIDDLETDISRLERQIRESRRGSESASERAATPGAV
jgi:outer membrane murein-binding lipoprotein Lpp